MDEPKNTGQFGKGNPGKPKGAVNKTTREVREAVGFVFNALQEDEGAPYTLVEWAKQNPGQFYQLASKLIPSVTQAKHEHSGVIEHRTVSETSEWISRVIGRGADSSLPQSLPN